ncbi:MAG: PIN domain-containing protein [Bryobacteraceae bacterium]
MPLNAVKFGLDTSCLIPLLATWHEHHAETFTAFESRLRRGHKAIVAIHALVECYSVLTRLPKPHRLAPEQARELLATTVIANCDLAGLPPGRSWSVLEDLASRGLGGGIAYDALIAEAVQQAGATVLLTWNVRDFQSAAPRGLEVRQP